MSAETFGFKINANGKALKKKQVWILEPSKDGDTVVLRSHLNKYLAVDQFGNVICDQVKLLMFFVLKEIKGPFIYYISKEGGWMG